MRTKKSDGSGSARYMGVDFLGLGHSSIVAGVLTSRGRQAYQISAIQKYREYSRDKLNCIAWHSTTAAGIVRRAVRCSPV